MYEHNFERPGVERSREMRTLKAKMRGVVFPVVAGAFAGFASLALVGQARAQVMASDETAGYVVFPKIEVADSGAVGGFGIDTLIQLTNTNDADETTVHCWYVNANGHCSNDPDTVCTPENFRIVCPLGGQCLQGWSPANFEITLTREQPAAWSARNGLSVDFPPGGVIPNSAVNEVPFIGELKCVQVEGPGADSPPDDRNDLKGEATIIRVQDPTAPLPPRMDAAAYNAVGFQAVEGTSGSSGDGNPLCLGELPAGAPAGTQCAMEYGPCPNVLIMDHFFDGAEPPFGGVVRTELTLVPCSEVLAEGATNGVVRGPVVTAQMLVYNEFEQRFSTSTRVECYRNSRLADIDTAPGPSDDAYSLFAAGVQGTVTGQTRIRGVVGPEIGVGYGLIGVAHEFYSESPRAPVDAAAAFNLHADIGFRSEGDAVYEVNTFETPSP